MSDFHAPDTGKRSPWERPMSQPDAPQASYQGPQQQAYQEPYQHPQDQAKGYQGPQPGYEHGNYYTQGYGPQGQAQQPQVVYVRDRRTNKDDVALGFCAGCLTGLCCCGCTVM
jgi:hypothetical protein